MLLRIAGIIFPVFAVAGIGWLYARWKRPDLTVVNDLNMDVLAPLLVFWALTDKPFSAAEFLDLTVGGMAVILGSGLLLLPISILRLCRLTSVGFFISHLRALVMGSCSGRWARRARVPGDRDREATAGD